jgi:hypothetical protein
MVFPLFQDDIYCKTTVSADIILSADRTLSITMCCLISGILSFQVDNMCSIHCFLSLGVASCCASIQLGFLWCRQSQQSSNMSTLTHFVAIDGVIENQVPYIVLYCIPTLGFGGRYGYETSRVPYFLDNHFTDGREVDSLMYRPPFAPKKIHGTQFY